MTYRIGSKNDMRDFIAADCRSLGLKNGRNFLFKNEIFLFQTRLRRLEYVLNCGKSPVRLLFRKYLFRRTSIKLGFSISPNTLGPGLSLAHRGTVIVNGGARIGANCRIHADVNIGTQAGSSSSAPTIGDNCYIGPGAKIFGEIVIGPSTVIGANAVVNKSFPEGNQTLGGVPANRISSNSSHGLLIKGYEASI